MTEHQDQHEPTLEDLAAEEQLNRTIASRFDRAAAENREKASKLDVETAAIRNHMAKGEMARVMAPMLKKKLEEVAAKKKAEEGEGDG